MIGYIELMNFNLINIQKLFFVVFIDCLFFGVINADRIAVIPLNRNWTLINQNSSIIKCDITLPSGVYSALYGEDVLYSWNDIDLRWIAYDNWTYTNYFDVNMNNIIDNHVVNLTFHGIDTIAKIFLNEYFVGETDNMFVRYTFNVTKYLQSNNILEVHIQSPIYAAKSKADILKKDGFIIPPECPNDRYHGECHINMLRKMQASFAWDWGLAAPSMGIWKSVVLEYYNVALIRDIDVAIENHTTDWIISINVFIDSIDYQDFYAILKLYAEELIDKPFIIDNYLYEPISYKNPVIRFNISIPQSKVKLWWPNGYGKQTLYPLYFTLKAWRNISGPSIHDRIKSQKNIFIGFRTIELIENPITEGVGNTFLFKVNGHEIFMKGSNYIPSHILPEYGQNVQKLKHLLESARDSHQNMIRVWGGGVYESNQFYNLADEYGLLIWQDMMFACAMYPITPNYLHSVRQEIRQNILRISYHPSIAIIATNNENEVALVQNWYGTYSENKRFRKEYRQLYLDTIMDELKILDYHNRSNLLISSPSNGKYSKIDNFISKNPQNPNYGDVHFYDVFKNPYDIEIYPQARFISEYGYQSLPSLTSWRRTMNRSELVNLDKLMKHRQHHPLGMSPITLMIEHFFPILMPDIPKYNEILIYFSQLAQAISMKAETDFYRSLRDTKHRTMGALYWQLNDVWVAPSWSAIDFYGNYKFLYYWSKEFLAPISIVALYDKKTATINVSLICDELSVTVTDLKVSLNIYQWNQLLPVNNLSWPVTLKANGVRYDRNISISDILKDNLNEQNAFLEFVLFSGKNALSNTYYFPNLFHKLIGVQISEIKLQISYKYCSCTLNGAVNNYSVTLTTKYPAIFVYLELFHSDVTNYKFSCNGFIQTEPIKIVHLEFESISCINITRNDIKLRTVNRYLFNKFNST